ncbi:hypothetical protein ACLB2K_068530 [Fragaria x ananassa]
MHEKRLLAKRLYANGSLVRPPRSPLTSRSKNFPCLDVDPIENCCAKGNAERTQSGKSLFLKQIHNRREVIQVVLKLAMIQSMGLSRSNRNLRLNQFMLRRVNAKRVSMKIITKISALNFGASSYNSCCDIVEESAPPERQVSPQERYRSALLRNRFADTIFKAKEKVLLEKVFKYHIYFMSLEKARLQAEARAAEEARKKAKAEAAAKARRQRELEREAARQALQMMEKTVEINENSRFMEDLEMFRAGDDDHLPHYIEETSPEHFHNELGSFKLQGSSNLVEQLGLFMKADDDIEIEDVFVVGYMELF